MLRDYQPPPLDAAKSEELAAFVKQRRAEIRAGKPRAEWRIGE
jgi:trimethylamine:corrinoid methyltransferase-like protein